MRTLTTARRPRCHRLALLLVLAFCGSLLAGLPRADARAMPAAPAALAAPAGVASWGEDSYGQLGDGKRLEPRYNPLARPVPGLGDIVAVAGGANFSLALRANGTVLAWGYDQFGQLGDGVADVSRVIASPTVVPGLGGVVAISAGITHAMALKADGTVLTWGDDRYGQLGDGTVGSPEGDPIPKAVPGLADVVAIAAGGTNSYAVKRDGTLLAWGNNFHGLLGNGTRSDSISGGTPTPAAVPGVGGVVDVSIDYWHVLVLKGDGTVLSWGYNLWGQLGWDDVTSGDPAVYAKPKAIPGMGGIVAIAAGDGHSLALKGDGTVLAWGHDTSGQLGDGTPNEPAYNVVPKPVPGLTGIVAISAGWHFSMALKADGTVWAWGHDEFGNLGDGTTNEPGYDATPNAAIGVTGATAIAAGYDHALAIVPFSCGQSFGDVGTGSGACGPIEGLAARGVIKGCDQEASPPRFCPDETSLRAQMAALIVRGLGWSGETPANTFTDKCDPLVPANCVDDELWNAIGILAAKDVARGYADGATCAPAAAPCYAARDDVLHAQVVSFITRAMVRAGHWAAATADDGTVYPNIPAASGHRLDFVTYTRYVGAVPGTADTTQAFAAWNTPATRAWFAQTLWLALLAR